MTSHIPSGPAPVYRLAPDTVDAIRRDLDAPVAGATAGFFPVVAAESTTRPACAANSLSLMTAPQSTTSASHRRALHGPLPFVQSADRLTGEAR